MATAAMITCRKTLRHKTTKRREHTCRTPVKDASDGVALETPVVAFGLLEHLPERALPLARLLVLLLNPQGDLHHAPRNIPIAPQGLHRLVVVARPRGLVEEWPPSVFVLANELDLLQRVLRLPLLHLLPDLPDRRLRGHRHREHAPM